ncbi:hypothetical protein JYG23_03895 [Sedimentibacter sp. zth1]|uniref:hypothetical protein n=1 Tax=Sedimentibacter sp. zth1 TaxID=2816908 RepID=UPI001A9162E9|nr:hypothetical protein [Sedimentibacter sp. zth1]QSX06609.1 hypothetical protein JYG23_03895 [Sedimentibacter sp. zth1]
MNQANWVAKERQRILSEAQTEADQLLDKARHQQDGLLDDTEIVKMAYDKAEEIIKSAENKAYEMKINSVEYSDNLLSKLQENISYLHSVVEDNRNELKNM